MSQEQRRDLTTWYVTAALFWFEAVGAMLLTAAWLISPLSCFGDRFESPGSAADGPCSSVEPNSLLTGPTGLWLALLVGVAAVFLLLWMATRDRPRSRGATCLAFGLAALGMVAWTATAGPIALFLGLLWTGVPALLLIGSASRLIASTPSPT